MLSGKVKGGKSCFFVSAPWSASRQNLTVQSSCGPTAPDVWSAGRVIDSGPSGYSALALTPSGKLMDLYMCPGGIGISEVPLDAELLHDGVVADADQAVSGGGAAGTTLKSDDADRSSKAAAPAAAAALSPSPPSLLPAGVSYTTAFPHSGKPGLAQLGDDLLLAHSGGIADYRCFGGAELRRSTDGGKTFGETICAIPADWSPKEGWCELPVPPLANMSTYGTLVAKLPCISCLF